MKLESAAREGGFSAVAAKQPVTREQNFARWHREIVSHLQQNKRILGATPSWVNIVAQR